MENHMDFEGKVVVVTGGANGIGRAIVEGFLNHGASVAVIDSDAASGAQLETHFAEADLFFYHGDIAEKEILFAFAEAVKQHFGRVDFLINNACISKKGILSDCSYEDFSYVLALGVTAPYLLTSLFLPIFQTGAAIVNIASSRAFMSQKDTESYSAAKGGISALTHALSISLAGRARVNAISPGWIDTGAYQKNQDYVPEYTAGDLLQHPVGRVGKPTDIAEMTLFLCSDAAGFITGQNITIDGGMSKMMIYHNDYGWTYNPDGE